MNEYWRQVKPLKIPNTYYTLCGYSRAANKTSFYIPELNILLDCGVPNDLLPDYIFVTHGHSDHSNHIPMNILSLGNFKNKIFKKPIFFVPHEIEQYVKDYIHTFYVMSKNNPTHKIHNKYELKGVRCNTQLSLIIKKRNYVIDIIKCFHRVPCVGYGFSEIREKIKDDYKNLTGKEIVELKRNNVEITQNVNVPLFCYLGDTTVDVFKVLDVIKYPVIIIECTFILNEDIKRAKEKSHVHWQELEPFIKLYSEKTFILYHFSNRYEKETIVEFFSKINYNNIIIWI